MSLFRTAANKANPLFPSVDKRNPKGPAKFRFHTNNDADAHATIAALIPLLRHHLCEVYALTTKKLSKAVNKLLEPILYRFFTPRAVTRSFKTEWNEAEGCFILQNDLQMMGVHDADPQFHFQCDIDTSILTHAGQPKLDNPDLQCAIDNDNKVPPPPQYQLGEDDSISTF
ncbi:hypothetical protein ACA910_001644 [Epithemia clementina (nom. ined.)]